jgi:hypothetical protein
MRIRPSWHSSLSPVARAPFARLAYSGQERSWLETKMRCFKLLGERVTARDFDRQVAELSLRAAIVYRFTRLGTPTAVAMTMP